MGWLEDVIDYVNQKGQGLGAGVYDYLNSPETGKESKTVFGKTPVETIADFGGAIGTVIHDASPTNLIRKAWEATGLEPEYGLTAFGKPVPIGLRSKNTLEQNQPLPSEIGYAPNPINIPETGLTNEQVLERIRADKSIKAEDAGKEQLSPETAAKLGGATPEEVEKAWKDSTSMLNQVTNKQMFPREEDVKKTTPEEDKVAKAEEMIGRAKLAAIRVLGYDPDSIDPQREALGNTYRHLQGSYYTPQQYNAVYNYYYKEAMDKKKSGATAVQHVMDRIVSQVGTAQTREDMQKQELQRKLEKDKADKEAKEATLAEKKKEYTEKAVERAANHYERAIEQLDKAFEKKYPMEEWDKWKQEDRDEYNRRMRNIRATYENAVKQHGYTPWADTGERTPQTGGTQAKSKYVIKSVK